MDYITYDEYGKEIHRVKIGGRDRYYLSHNGSLSQLDYALRQDPTPYEIHTDPKDLTSTVTTMGQSEPSCSLFAGCFARESKTGGRLDFKQRLPDRSLWNAGSNLYVHKDKVGNAAWAFFGRKQGLPLWLLKLGAQAYARSQGQSEDDPEDMDFITRGFRLFPGR